MAETHTVIRGGLAGAAAVMLTVSGLGYYAVQQEDRSNRLVLHTQQVLAALDAVSTSVAGAEAGAHSFAVTGEGRHLEEMNRAGASVPPELDHLSSLVADNPAQQLLVNRLRDRIGDAFGAFRNAVANRRSRNEVPQANLDRQRVVMEALQVVIREIRAEEDRLLERRALDDQQAARRTGRVMTALVVTGAASLAWGYLLLVADADRRRRHAIALQRANDELEGRVDTRTKELRDARDVAEAERQRLTAILNASPALIALHKGPDHVFTFVNETHRRVVRRESLGQPIRVARPELAGQPLLEYLDRAYATGELYEAAEVPLRLDWTGTGTIERRFLNFSLLPTRDAAGAVDGILLHAVDVTPQVEGRERVDAALKDQQQAHKDAEAASRIKDEFLLTLSHELRTPLTAIYGWARMLRSGNVPEDRWPRAIEVIEQNALAQTQLVNDLLDVSSVISGRLRLSVRPVDLVRVINAAIDSMQPAADAKGITLHAVLDPNAGPIMGDPERLQQVVWNLLSNAIKFTPKQGRVQLRLARVHSHAEVVVSDTGPGIPAEFVPYVFDRFRQAEGGTTRRHGGLGLGLAIVRHLVELHGGTVSAEHTEGQGAVFRIVLPLTIGRDAANNTDKARSRAGQPIDSTAKRLDRTSILVVDDESQTRDLFGVILEDAGAQIRNAASASEALSIMDAWWPDVLLSDIEMPLEDGYELMRKVQVLAAAAGRTVVAVAVTAYARAEDRMRALEAGFHWYLSKPVEPSDLVSVIASLVERRQTL
jgi:signal transduction histidine kinase/CHASE3 domain sensor protein/ActR/RegA family two-component response regulator